MGGLLWDSVREEFVFDGGWRDIYVLKTDISDWQRMLDAIRQAGYAHVYYRDEEQASLPEKAVDAFPLSDKCDRRLAVRFENVQANCHFFTTEEIEFDIDPSEVDGQMKLDALIGFMRCVANAVGKDVILTPENFSETVIFRVRPGKPEIEYDSFGGWHDWRK